MKFEICEGINSFNGTPMFYVYKTTALERRFCAGYGTLEDARAFVHRQLHPSEEKLIEEIDGDGGNGGNSGNGDGKDGDGKLSV